MKPTNVTGYPFSNGDRLTAVSVNQICNALDAIQDYNDTIKEFEDLVEENTEEIKSEINRVAYDDVSVNGIAGEIGAGKQAIAAAINAKGGSASATESFAELVDDVINLNDSFITYGVEVTEKIHWLRFICEQSTVARLPLIAIDDDIVTTISQSNAFQSCTALECVKMTALTTISGGGYVFQGCVALQEVNMPNLTVISGGSVFASCSALQEVNMPNLTVISDGSYVFNTCSALQYVNLPNLTTISGGSVFRNCLSLQRVEFPNLTKISSGYTFDGCRNLEEIYLPELLQWTDATYATRSCTNLKAFIAPKLTYVTEGYYGLLSGAINVENIIVGTLTSQFTFNENYMNNLRNISIGQDTDINLNFANWKGANVIAEGQSGIDELNSNLYNNLLTKLYDHSQDGQTRTLRIGWLAKVTAENIAYANAKGWTLTT